MTILQTIHHKKNELFEVEFYKEKFLETFDFLNEENVSEMVCVVFEGNELREIVKSKFEAINKK